MTRSSSESERKFKNRRKVLPGYPVYYQFKSINEVRDYLSGDRIVCLICGKTYKKLGYHLEAIHGVTCDQYREMYNIPWTYGLLSEQSVSAYSAAVRKRMDEGYKPPCKYGEDILDMATKKKRKCPFKEEVALQNMPKYELVENDKGELKSKTALNYEKRTKKGTVEYKKAMQSRPQCQPEVTGKRLGKYWKGRKQSAEHLEKRKKAINGEDWELKSKDDFD